MAIHGAADIALAVGMSVYVGIIVILTVASIVAPWIYRTRRKL